MIIVAITGPGMKEALAQVSRSSPHADMFEFRLDMIRGFDLDRLLRSTRKPKIVTCRPRWEGGEFTGDETKRLRILEHASMCGAEFVDIELGCGREVIERFTSAKRGAAVIVSRHNYSGRHFDPGSLFKQLQGTRADVVKVAYAAKDCSDNRMAFDFLRHAARAGRKAIAIAMGPAGEPSRILYKKFGGWATYGAPEDGRPSAPGQITASLMKRLFRSEDINRSTKVYGVIGNPVGQSKGIYLHNELFRKYGMNAVYCRFQVADLRGFMKHMAPMVEGLSVTIPHKEAILRHLDRVDPTAAAIGAVNTVYRRGKKLAGENSDAPAALDAIEKLGRVEGKTLLITGAGGTARAIAYAAKRRGATVVIANRTEKKAKTLAREFGLGYARLRDLRKIRFDILANATSVGMAPRATVSPVPRSILKGATVFDAVYNPVLTKLLCDARRAGARGITGAEMFLRQAVRQAELFCGRKPDTAVMRRILFKHL